MSERISWVIGKYSVFKRSVFQAAAAALIQEDQLPFTLSQITSDSRFKSCDYFIRAHRTSIASGSYDGGEVGAGAKLLHLLERMEIENVVIVVFVWDHGGPCALGSGLFKMVIERAKELLMSVHDQVVQINSPEPVRTPHIREMPLESLPKTKPRVSDLKQTRSESDLDLPDLNMLMATGDVRTLETHLSSAYVKSVLTAACALLQKFPPTWDEVKRLINDRELFKRLSKVKVSELKASQLMRASKALKFPKDLLQNELRRTSLVALSLYKSVIYILNSHSKSRTSARPLSDVLFATTHRKYGRFLPVREMVCFRHVLSEVFAPLPEGTGSDREFDHVLQLERKQMALKEKESKLLPVATKNTPIDTEARVEAPLRKNEEEEARIRRLLDSRLEEYEINTSIAASLENEQTLNSKQNVNEDQPVDVLLTLANRRLRQRRIQDLSLK